MKKPGNIPKLLWILALALPLVAVLAGCGKKKENNNNSVAAVAAPAIPVTCSLGQVLSPSYGCLQPYQGQQGYGNYNGQAVAASCWSGTVMTANGCQTQNPTGQIPNYPDPNYPKYPTYPTYPDHYQPHYPKKQKRGKWMWNEFSGSWYFYYYY